MQISGANIGGEVVGGGNGPGGEAAKSDAYFHVFRVPIDLEAASKYVTQGQQHCVGGQH